MIAGDERPKQFCAILGEETLLGQTRSRVALAVRPAQTLFVLTHTHEPFYDSLARPFRPPPRDDENSHLRNDDCGGSMPGQFIHVAPFVPAARQPRKEMKVSKAMTAKEASIYITEPDRQRLEKLVEIAGERDRLANHQYLRKLEHELDRAEAVTPGEVPGDVITMRSKVRLKDLNTGEEMVYTLVFPTEAHFDEGKISVLAPVGTAMLGYRLGDVIEWEVPSGLRRLKVEEIIYQPEAAGEYNL